MNPYFAAFRLVANAEHFAANLEAFEDEAENIQVEGSVVTWESPKSGQEYEIALAEVILSIEP